MPTRHFLQSSLKALSKLSANAGSGRSGARANLLIKSASTPTSGAPAASYATRSRDPILDLFQREQEHDNKLYKGGDDAISEGQRRRVDPDTTSVLLFPGQGTQFVGMCGDVSSLPRETKELYEVASAILGYDLLDLCANGPIEKLNQTVYCQPAVFISSLAAIDKLRDKNPQSIENCVCTAGFSVGELTALVFSGILTLEDGVRIVKARAEAMQLQSDLVQSGMATVLYGADSKLNYGLKVAREWCTRQYNIKDPVCSIANYLFPHCKVIGGHLRAIEFLEENYKDFNLRKVKRLPVSGAFHTEIMAGAANIMRETLSRIQLNVPRMPVFSNVTGRKYNTEKELRKLLPKQIWKPVLWEQTIQKIYERPKETEFPHSYECGPGTSISTVLKMVNAKAHGKCQSISP